MQRATHIVLFDDQCPMCTFQTRALTWLDWFNVTTFVPMSDPRVRQIAPTLSPDDLSAAIHCITPGGRIHRGARCFRHLGLRMPLLVPIALFFWVPGVIQVAEWVYARVSRNRYLLSRIFRCKEACKVLPQRARRNEKEIPAASAKP